MKDFLKNKQKWIVGLVILGLMFVAGGFGVASYLYGNRCYRGYEVAGNSVIFIMEKMKALPLRQAFRLCAQKWQDRALLRFFCRIRIPMF